MSIPPEVVAEAARFYIEDESDPSMQEVAEHFGIENVQALYRLINEHTDYMAFTKKRQRRYARRNAEIQAKIERRARERKERAEQMASEGRLGVRPGTPPKVPRDHHESIVLEYIHTDATLEDIAGRYEVTRERIRQIINAADPNAYVKKRHFQVKGDQAELEAKFERRCRNAIENDLRCLSCGGWVLRGRNHRTCSHECAEAWKVLRTVPEIVGNKHRENVAKHILSYPEKHSESKIEWAEKMLSDDPPEINRRFFQKGSKRAEVIREFRPDIYEKIMGEDA